MYIPISVMEFRWFVVFCTETATNANVDSNNVTDDDDDIVVGQL